MIRWTGIPRRRVRIGRVFVIREYGWIRDRTSTNLAIDVGYVGCLVVHAYVYQCNNATRHYSMTVTLFQTFADIIFVVYPLVSSTRLRIETKVKSRGILVRWHDH